MNIYTRFFTILLALLISACGGMIPANNVQINSRLPTSVTGKAFTLVTLDKLKNEKVKTGIIGDLIIESMAQKGMRLVDAKKEVPDYFIMFDYATEIGLKQDYEHVFLLIAYDARSGIPFKQIYRARVQIDQKNKDVVDAVKVAIRKINKTFPQG